jgi:hypothetical protein
VFKICVSANPNLAMVLAIDDCTCYVWSADRCAMFAMFDDFAVRLPVRDSHLQSLSCKVEQPHDVLIPP